MTEALSFDLVIIGSGPAGYVASIRAAQLGMKVACVEKQFLGGTCLNVGCIPSKALLESSELYAQAQHKLKDHGIVAEGVRVDFPKMMARKDAVVRQLTSGIGGLFKKNKVTHLRGTAQITKDKKVNITGGDEPQTVEAKHIVIATGSSPIELPFLKFDGKRIIDSTGALALSEIPKELIVIGGGYIGLEMGSVYLRLGSTVTVIEALERIVPNMDIELGSALQRVLTKQGMKFHLATKVKSGKVKGDRVELVVADAAGKETTLGADVVLVSVGRKPHTEGLGLADAGITQDPQGRIVVNERFETNVTGVYAVGDVIAGPMLAHKASEEGVALVEMLAGHTAHVNYDAIPGVVYTWPEAASVGLSEEQAKEKGIHYNIGKFPFMANGRAIAMGEKDGFVKLIADATTGKLIGGHIIGPRASDMIAELVLGMEFSAVAADLALTIHAHPTLSEVVKEAAIDLTTGKIHL
ncbi:MAG: dihydrolipoyl dehydrogenase [Deltaproteobacteria bacterium]|nr:dihydrolipoyl dehydrogenase [Deltaproteobacteria bacterium]